MDYREFTDAVETRINQKLTGGMRAEIYNTIKNNGKERTGILIQSPGINISPTIYLEEYYESYLHGTDLNQIIEEILGFYENIKKEKSWDYEKILDFDNVRNKIVFKLVNTEKNRKFLSKVPSLAFLDLSIVFYVLLEANEEGTAAMAVTDSHARYWNVQADDLWKEASCNVKHLLPAEFFTMNYALREIMNHGSGCEGIRSAENLFIGTCHKRDGMYVLSNKLRSYGAACIAYPHILKMIGQILRQDFYILPSSVHEVIVLPYYPGISSREMDEMVCDINATQVAAEEVLSDHVYLYERSTGRLRSGGEIKNAVVI